MIFLITPTGARINQFAHCAAWMKQQTYEGEVTWIIVDDAIPITTNSVKDNFRKNWHIRRIYPRPQWRGENSQARNIKAGMDHVKENYKRDNVEAIFIIEDDDYYKPCYIDDMMRHSGNYNLWGETNTIYYNVLWRQFIINNNRHHASLFQTAIRWDAIPIIENCYRHQFIDAQFWTVARNKHLFFDNYLSVGIKGMPGRRGIGAGHTRMMRMANDTGMTFLTRIIGDDAKVYAKYYRDRGKPQYPLFASRRH